jgi:hypothetical protein
MTNNKAMVERSTNAEAERSNEAISVVNTLDVERRHGDFLLLYNLSKQARAANFPAPGWNSNG